MSNTETFIHVVNKDCTCIETQTLFYMLGLSWQTRDKADTESLPRKKTEQTQMDAYTSGWNFNEEQGMYVISKPLLRITY